MREASRSSAVLVARPRVRPAVPGDSRVAAMRQGWEPVSSGLCIHRPPTPTSAYRVRLRDIFCISPSGVVLIADIRDRETNAREKIALIRMQCRLTNSYLHHFAAANHDECQRLERRTTSLASGCATTCDNLDLCPASNSAVQASTSRPRCRCRRDAPVRVFAAASASRCRALGAMHGRLTGLPPSRPCVIPSDTRHRIGAQSSEGPRYD